MKTRKRTGCRICCVWGTLLAFSALPSASAADNESLAERFSPGGAATQLLSASDWHPFPRADERAAWEQLPPDAAH